jgi:hypothetical protein
MRRSIPKWTCNLIHDTEFPVPDDLQGNVAITSLSKIYNWSRRNSMWPMLFGLACCAIEMIATAASRYDLSRFGMGSDARKSASIGLNDCVWHRYQKDGRSNCALV